MPAYAVLLFDETVTFRGLGLAHVGAVVDIQRKDVQKRLVDRKLTLSLTKAAKDLLAEQGFDPTFGARPLKRTIQPRPSVLAASPGSARRPWAALLARTFGVDALACPACQDG